jgi:hypothetical protein
MIEVVPHLANGLSFYRLNRQDNSEDTPPPFFTFYLDPAPIHLDCPSGDGQPQPGTA